MEGLFITFEGSDGVGKTTQVELLATRLRALGHVVTVTREPGGTELGTAIRQWLLASSAEEPLTWEAEVFLLAADRAQHVRHVIAPALARGEIVVCDRYIDSSLVYQGLAAGHTSEVIWQVNEIATQGLLPDITFLLAVPPEVCFTRLEERDHIEQRGLDFQRQVYQGYLALARQTPRMQTLRVAGMSRTEVAGEIWQNCRRRWPWLEGSH